MKIGMVAKSLNVSSATIRNWLDDIGPEFFTESATRSTGKNFQKWDMNQLHKIQQLKGEGISLKDIPQHLEPTPNILEREEPETYQEPASNEIVLHEYMQQFREVYEKWIQDKDQQIAELKAKIEYLEKPWWKKLFK
jgi:DNA-binding transcriptional MerR regulator